MSIFGNRGVYAATMEDETVTIGDNEPGGADSVEADLVDVTNIAADVEGGVTEVEKAQGAAEDLDTVGESLEATLDNHEGGADPQTIENLNVTIESARRRLGLSTSKSLLTIESFVSKTAGSRRVATLEALNRVKNLAGNAWAAIVRGWETLKAFVVQLVQKVIGTAERLDKRADALQTKISTLAASATSTGDVKNSGISRLLGGGAKPTKGSMLNAAGPLSVSSPVETVFDETAAVKTKAGFEAAKLNVSLGDFKATSRQAAEGFAWYAAKSDPAELVQIHLPKQNLTGEAAFKAMKEIKLASTSSKEAGPEKIPALSSKDELTKGITKAKELIQQAKNSRENAKTFEKQIADRITGLKKLAGDSNAGNEEGAATRGSLIRSALSSQQAYMNRMLTGIFSGNLSKAGQTLNWVERSLATFGSKDAADKAAEKK